jgi:acetyl-CoA C-acetyltransferase
MTEAVIVATARSPIGRAAKGSLVDVRPDDMTAAMVSAALAKVPELDPADIDDFYLGCGRPGGEQGFNMARVVATMLGYDHLPGATLTRYCASSIQTTRMAFHAIKAGEGDVFISAGVEAVSRSLQTGDSDGPPQAGGAPRPATRNPIFAKAQQRTAQAAKGGVAWHDPREEGQLPDIYIAMGQTAENLAQSRGITRQELDQFGVRSQNLAEKALVDGFWQREIVPLTRPDGVVVLRDDGPRPGVTYEAVAALKPVFRPDGLVTAGNCCPLNDGAAAVVVMSGDRMRALGLTPLGRFVGFATAGVAPDRFGIGPVPAVRKVLKQTGLALDQIDLVEINEAFAAQVLACLRELPIDPDRMNVNGGAIALGHPLGCTGAKLTATLLYEMQRRGSRYGLVTMCVGGGMGAAGVFEKC